MRANRWLIRSWIALTLWALMLGPGCASDYIRDDNFRPEEPEFRIDEAAQIVDDEAHRSILEVMAQYRQALTKKDFGTINRLIAPDYYDNSATTNTTKDDYGREQLGEIFEMLANHAESIQYRVTIKDVEIVRDQAYIDYEYRYAYQYRVGEDVSWDAGVEINRVSLKQVDGQWKIVSGL